MVLVKINTSACCVAPESFNSVYREWGLTNSVIKGETMRYVTPSIDISQQQPENNSYR